MLGSEKLAGSYVYDVRSSCREIEAFPEYYIKTEVSYQYLHPNDFDTTINKTYNFSCLTPFSPFHEIREISSGADIFEF